MSDHIVCAFISLHGCVEKVHGSSLYSRRHEGGSSISYSIDESTINAHQIFIGWSIKNYGSNTEHRKHILAAYASRNYKMLHKWVLLVCLTWGKRISSVWLLSAFLEYFSDKLIKFTFFSASTFPQPTLSTSTLDNYLLYFPEFHSTTPGEQAWTCCIQLSYVYCMCG